MRKAVLISILTFTALIIILLFELFPIYWVIVSSLRTRAEIVGMAPFHPTSFRIENYYDVFVKWKYYEYIVNSLIVASGNTLLVILLALPAAYALTRFRIGPARHLSFWFLTNRMAPPAAFLLPLYILLSFLKLSGSYLGLIIAYALFNIPLSIWMLMAAIESIPREIEEAALLDGVSYLGIFIKIVIPLAKSGIVATSLLVWLFAWNHYIFGMILSGPGTKLMTVALGDFALTTVGIEWEYVATMTVGTIIPVFIVLFIVRKALVSGFAFGKI
jgi:multiple sugar transport system permease protein